MSEDRKRIEEIREWLKGPLLTASPSKEKFDFLLTHIDKLEAALREIRKKTGCEEVTRLGLERLSFPDEMAVIELIAREALGCDDE